jgi:predicted sulfurtransferase
MIIQTSNAKFLIESCGNRKDCVFINSNSKEELGRFFGSLDVLETNFQEYPFQVKSCKQEFANALIIMVKEIDYSHFWSLDLQFI